MEAAMQAMQQQMADMKRELDNTKVQLAAAQASAAQANQQATAAAAAASASASASSRATGAARGAQAPASATPVIDTRILGKPDAFHGEKAKWRDWSVILRSYTSVLNSQLGDLMKKAESSDAPVLNAVIDDSHVPSSNQLYFILLMLCRGIALDKVVNAGELEGLEAWRQLNLSYEPRVRSRFAGQLLEILGWNFAGDVIARMEAFEREIHLYETSSKEKMSPGIKIGVVLRQLEEGQLKQHLLMNAERLIDWDTFKSEIISIRRAQATAGTTVSMDVGSAGKGPGSGKGNKWCNVCRKATHNTSDCWNKASVTSPKGGGKGKGDGGKGKGKGSKGKGKGKGSKNSKNVDCWKCGKTGHFASECRSTAHGVEGHDYDDYEERWTTAEWENWQSEHASGHTGEPQAEPSAAPSPDSAGSLGIEGLWMCGVTCVSTKIPRADLSAVGVPTSVGRSNCSCCHNVSDTRETLTLGVDSGSVVTIIPRHCASDYPVEANYASTHGYCYTAADNGLIYDDGTRNILAEVNGSKRGFRCHVADVSKGLISVANMIDNDHDVVFSSSGSYAKNKTSGEITPFIRRGNIFDIDLKVIPFGWPATLP